MAERGKGFPTISLSNAVLIVEKASKFGKEWSRETFASYGAKKNAGSAKSGAFAMRISALKDYGLILTDKDKIVATDLMQAIVKPMSETERSQAIQQAFKSANVFSQVFDNLDGNVAIEKNNVLEYAVREIGVSRDSMNRFFTVFVESGKYAGLIEYNKDNDSITLLKTDASFAPEEQVANNVINNNHEVTAISPTIIQNLDSGNDTVSERGVNRSGNDWRLTAVVRTSQHLPKELRQKISKLLDDAEDIADELYELDKVD